MKSSRVDGWAALSCGWFLMLAMMMLLGFAHRGLAADVPLTMTNPNFEQATNQQPTGWTFTRWNCSAEIAAANGIDEGQAAEGRRAAYVSAVSSGAIGFSANRPTAFPAELSVLRLSISVKASEDYQGNRPWIFILWYRDGQWIKERSDIGEFQLPKNQWTTATLDLPRDRIPAQANQALVCLATIFDSRKGPTAQGKLFFDQVQLISLDVPPNFAVLPQARLAWNRMGQPVVYQTPRPDAVPASVRQIVGTITDSQNRPVAKVAVDRDTFLTQGWSWMPSQPGYYEVEFTCQDLQGKVLSTLSYSWRFRSLKTQLLRYFDETRFSFVVADGPAKPMSQRSPLLGVMDGGIYTENIEDSVYAADQLGAAFMGLRFMDWYEIEKEKGVYTWGAYDQWFQAMRARGFPIMICLYGTPRWASPYPEKTQQDICVPGYSAFAPNNMQDFSDFLKQVVQRYGKDVKTWEIWNEPHLSHASVFWRDTPEKFVQLLKTGYETIKQVQPEAQIWIGGMGGRRYLVFYQAILKLGAWAYFDRLALHGSWIEPSGYRELEKRFKATSHPWVDSEWHAILMTSTDPIFPSELELSKRMLMDLTNQIKHGVENIQVFCMFEYTPRRALLWGKEEGWWMNGGGFFQKTPFKQPRQATIVLRNFTDRVRGPVAYHSEQLLNNQQKSVTLASDAGSLMLLWSESQKPETIDPRVALLLAGGARLHDWEGRAVHPSENQTWLLEPRTMYWVTDFALPALAGWPESGQVLPLPPNTGKTDGLVKGQYTAGPLWDAKGQPIAANIQWNENGKVYRPHLGRPAAAEFDARYAIAANAQGIDLLIDVKDAHFIQRRKIGEFYEDDSIQFALATDAMLTQGTQAEFQIALTANGPVVYKESAPYIGGDLPMNWSGAKQVARYAKADIEPIAGGMQYRIHFDASELYPWSWSDGEPIRLGLLVNNSNGQGRLGYVEWGDGIGQWKDPAKYSFVSPTRPAAGR